MKHSLHDTECPHGKSRISDFESRQIQHGCKAMRSSYTQHDSLGHTGMRETFGEQLRQGRDKHQSSSARGKETYLSERCGRIKRCASPLLYVDNLRLECWDQRMPEQLRLTFSDTARQVCTFNECRLECESTFWSLS